jgi:hypothetical protein
MIDIFSPRRQFMSVDLPTFGLPMMAMKPDLKFFASFMAVEYPKCPVRAREEFYREAFYRRERGGRRVNDEY